MKQKCDERSGSTEKTAKRPSAMRNGYLVNKMMLHYAKVVHLVLQEETVDVHSEMSATQEMFETPL